MIIGNPDKFAFLLERVDEWTAENSPYVAGLFFTCINGNLFPPNIENTTISSDLWHLFKKGPSSALKFLSMNEELFLMEKEKAFKKIFDLTFPGCFDPHIDLNIASNNYNYKFSTVTQEDNNCFLFAVSNGNNVRILGSLIDVTKKDDEDIYSIHGEVSEIFLPICTVQKYIIQLEEFYSTEIEDKNERSDQATLLP